MVGMEEEAIMIGWRLVVIGGDGTTRSERREDICKKINRFSR